MGLLDIFIDTCVFIFTYLSMYTTATEHGHVCVCVPLIVLTTSCKEEVSVQLFIDGLGLRSMKEIGRVTKDDH